MANDFKRFPSASLGTTAGASATAVYTVPSSSSTAMESIVIGITLANKSNAGITASVFLDNFDGSNDVFIVKDFGSGLYVSLFTFNIFHLIFL